MLIGRSRLIFDPYPDAPLQAAFPFPLKPRPRGASASLRETCGATPRSPGGRFPRPRRRQRTHETAVATFRPECRRKKNIISNRQNCRLVEEDMCFLSDSALFWRGSEAKLEKKKQVDVCYTKKCIPAAGSYLGSLYNQKRWVSTPGRGLHIYFTQSC